MLICRTMSFSWPPGCKWKRRPTQLFAQLLDELVPFAVQHGFQAFFGNVTRTDAVETVVDFLVVRGNRFGNRPGGRSYSQEPSRDFLGQRQFRRRSRSWSDRD